MIIRQIQFIKKRHSDLHPCHRLDIRLGYSRVFHCIHKEPPNKVQLIDNILIIVFLELRPKKVTLMVLVGVRTTFSARTNFFFNLKKIYQINSQKHFLQTICVGLLS